jgi:hypothetical protein
LLLTFVVLVVPPIFQVYVMAVVVPLPKVATNMADCP